uniref:CSON004777 protein n=1 Tax=Culicoides sonorensis TaxID=179676 RepID=A0A336MT62_CULSO
MSENSTSTAPVRRGRKIDASLTEKFNKQNCKLHSTASLKRRNEYGKPKSGSLTEMRGQKASIAVFQDVLQVCEQIDTDGEPYNDEGHKGILFGNLFQIYTLINDKLVGLLLRARKHSYVDFEGEILFQRYHDDTPIFLTDTIENIRNDIRQKQNEIKKQIADNPVATTLL